MDTDKSSWEASSLSSVPRSTYWSSLLSAVPTVLELSFHPTVRLVEANSNEYAALFPASDELLLDGYFQHSRYVEPIYEELRWLVLQEELPSKLRALSHCFEPLLQTLARRCAIALLVPVDLAPTLLPLGLLQRPA